MSTETVSKKLFNIDEFYRMYDVGILPEDGRFELIRGEVIGMGTPEPPHTSQVNRLNQVFSSRFAGSVIVSFNEFRAVAIRAERIVELVEERLGKGYRCLTFHTPYRTSNGHRIRRPRPHIIGSRRMNLDFPSLVLTSPDYSRIGSTV